MIGLGVAELLSGEAVCYAEWRGKGVPVFDTFSSGIWRRSEALSVALLIWVSSFAVGGDSDGGVCVV